MMAPVVTRTQIPSLRFRRSKSLVITLRYTPRPAAPITITPAFPFATTHSPQEGHLISHAVNPGNSQRRRGGGRRLENWRSSEWTRGAPCRRGCNRSIQAMLLKTKDIEAPRWALEENDVNSLVVARGARIQRRTKVTFRRRRNRTCVYYLIRTCRI
jgi:hypothetical protein